VGGRGWDREETETGERKIEQETSWYIFDWLVWKINGGNGGKIKKYPP
jgi:hypothetical protein